MATGGSQQALANGHGDAIHWPRITPLGPTLKAFGLCDCIPEPQPGNAIELGEAADHHQIPGLGHQRNQRLLLAIGHQRQKGFIADHQTEPLQQRFQRDPTPELAGGVVGIADPQHISFCGWRNGLRTITTPGERQLVTNPGPIPTIKGSAVIGEAGRRQQARARYGRISRRPGEQFRGPISRQQ